MQLYTTFLNTLKDLNEEDWHTIIIIGKQSNVHYMQLINKLSLSSSMIVCEHLSCVHIKVNEQEYVMKNNLNTFLIKGVDWSCIHIDDPRPPKFRLPSLHKCLSIRPSDLIAGQLTILKHPEFLLNQSEGDHNDEADDGDDDDMPQLVDEDDDVSHEVKSAYVNLKFWFYTIRLG